ncbi:50S ribosomal protein L18 [Buchnera aphidicola (Pterocallis alni)]|uniref:50S ribosomal protein L18 n=1 Tax=Buchnera aphidicola TaxID=9 RepID=UPI003463FCAE
MNFLIKKKYQRKKRSYKMRMKLKKLHAIRLVVHRTARHMYAQVIDSDFKTILVSASTLEKDIRKLISGYTGNKEAASLVGEIIATRAIQKGIKVVSFDRSGFKYHGRIKMLAESARKMGLNF